MPMFLNTNDGVLVIEFACQVLKVERVVGFVGSDMGQSKFHVMIPCVSYGSGGLEEKISHASVGNRHYFRSAQPFPVHGLQSKLIHSSSGWFRHSVIISTAAVDSP